MIRKIIYPFLLIAGLVALTCCKDDFDPGGAYAGEGVGTLHLTAEFEPLVDTKTNVGESRGTEPGDLISTIGDLTVFVYDENKELIKIYSQSELSNLKIASQTKEGYNTSMPTDAGGPAKQAEAKTDRATFEIDNFDFGKYYIFALANMGKITDAPADRARFATVDMLQSTLVEWNETNIGLNNQMYGYFTYDGNDDKTSRGFISDGPLVVGYKTMTLHSWLKRAASKITVVYDGKNLHDGVEVYIKSITLKDIPKYCPIGKTNTPTTVEPDSMIADGGIIYYGKDGELKDDTEPADDYRQWMVVTNGTRLKGAVEYKNDTTYTTHDEKQGALYFYENCQGNYPNDPRYDKKQDWSVVGFISNKPGDYDYKDDVPYGTYVEVEGYYVSTNPDQVTDGPIKYRFMLGQDVDYDYNAIRNHHYKLTLSFNGWADQSDWHIEYEQPYDTINVDPTYYVSYTYNTKAIFPIRMLGDVESLDVEIVENNWAPLDSMNNQNGAPDRDKYLDVPPAYVRSSSGREFDDFRWWRAVYLGAAVPAAETPPAFGLAASYYEQPTPTNKYYSLQKPWNREGTAHIDYSEEDRKKGAPEKVTPIWAGFLTLRPGNDLNAIEFADKNYSTDYDVLKKHYYDNKQNYRTFPEKDLNFDDWEMGKTCSRKVGALNMECEVVKASDGSTTVKLPVWTRPKSMLGISGFTGNNPYENYQRRAVLKITAKFKDRETPVVIYKPVYQVRRIVNPKAVWRRHNDDHPFEVRLMHRVSPTDESFSPFLSQGAWRAWVKTFSPGDEGFITLQGGIAVDSEGAIVGGGETPVQFNIIFNGTISEKASRCAIIMIQYHGFTCQHSIYVRQGYNEPLAIGNSANAARWSSFSVYSFAAGVPFGKQWTPSTPVKASDYIDVELNKTPMALGTYFKRGNYSQAIPVANNQRDGLGALRNPDGTTFIIADIDHPYKLNGAPNGLDQLLWTGLRPANNTNTTNATVVGNTWHWARFKATVAHETRYYRVPTLADYQVLADEAEFGIGVMYADGASTVEESVERAFEYWDATNDGQDDHNPPEYDTTPDNPDNKKAYGGASGMRGLIVYNPETAHQIFFQVGARGVGRRTVQLAQYSSTNPYGVNKALGMLRYGALFVPFANGSNNYRPIPYNNPGAEGAIYWINTGATYYDPREGNLTAFGWDMNYFDLNFTPYDKNALVGTNGSDALPIKLVIDENGPK